MGAGKTLGSGLSEAQKMSRSFFISSPGRGGLSIAASAKPSDCTTFGHTISTRSFSLFNPFQSLSRLFTGLQVPSQRIPMEGRADPKAIEEMPRHLKHLRENAHGACQRDGMHLRQALHRSYRPFTLLVISLNCFELMKIILKKTDPRTRMQSTKNQSKTLIIDLGQRQESATPGNDLCRLLSSLILVDKSCQRLLSTTRVNNMRRRQKT